MSAFEEVKRVNIYSGRALAEELGKIRETLSKSSNDWKVSINRVSIINPWLRPSKAKHLFRQVRIEALQMLRSLLLAGAANYDEMYNALRTLDVPFQASFPSLTLLMKSFLQDGAYKL